MIGEASAAGESLSGENEQVLGQLDLFLDSERKDIEDAILKHESSPPNHLDPIEKKIAYNEDAAKLVGRAEQLQHFTDWRNSLQKQ